MRGRFRLAEAFEHIRLGFVVPTGTLKERKSERERRAKKNRDITQEPQRGRKRAKERRRARMKGGRGFTNKYAEDRKLRVFTATAV